MNTVFEEHVDNVCLVRESSINFLFGSKPHTSDPDRLFVESKPKAPTIAIFLRYPTKLAACRDFYNPSSTLLFLCFLCHYIKLALRLPAYLVPVRA